MIHLIVGNTGAGKTTYSLQLKEKIKGVIFSIDQWNKVLFLPDKQPSDGLDWFLERIERSEYLILSLIEQLEERGIDSILDLGLSKYEHREKFRAFASENGYVTHLHFLDISKETRCRRITNRNKEKGSTYEFEVSKADFEFMEGWFEKPTSIELKDGTVVNE